MDEHMPAAADLQRKIHEKEGRLNAIISVAGELIERDIKEHDDMPADSRRFYASATYREAHGNERIGLLSFTRQPDLDPDSILEITYNEHGFGDKRDETDQSYVISRTNDGDLIIQVSDVISLDGFNQAMEEANSFAEEIEGKDVDPEMLATAWEDLESNAHSAISQENHEAGLSLHPATEEEIARLEEILTIARNRTDWDQVDHENEMRAMDEEYGYEKDSQHMSRRRKFTRQAWRLLTRRR